MTHHYSQLIPNSSKLISYLLVLLFLGACGNLEEETYKRPDANKPSILVDLWHTRIQNPEDYRLTKGHYVYQGNFGYARLFDHFENNGYDWQSIRTMPLSKPRLEGFDVLFINLLHDSRPDFTDEEIEAIQWFVHNGGGLVLIADHTNVYRHAERVNPLLEPMGIQVMYSTAVDYPPEYSVSGLGWIMAWDIKEHPITDDVEMISMQTGGSFDTDQGFVFTSDQSFADFWDESEERGFYGNWQNDGDPEIEPPGPLTIVAANHYGEGRVAVVGDQNIFGDAWLHFGNNFELAVNMFEWAAKREDSSPRLKDIKPVGLNIAADLIHNEFRTGRTEDNGYYNFFVHLNRDQNVTGRATMKFNDHHDVMMFLNPDVTFDSQAISAIEEHLASGQQVVLSMEATRINKATWDLLHHLVPELTLSFADNEIAFDAPLNDDHYASSIPTITSTLPVEASWQSLNTAIEIAAYNITTTNGERVANPYILDIQSAWGEPLYQVSYDDKKIDIARHALVNGGELIIFFQDGFWRNHTMGSKESEPPNDENRPAIDLLYDFLDYLKQLNAE